MPMSAKLLFVALIGVVAGWQADKIMQALHYLTGQIARRTGFGLVGAIIMGAAGALIATSLFPAIAVLFQLLGNKFYLQDIFVAALGSILMLIIMRLARGRLRAD